MKMNIACEDVNIFGQPTVVDSGQNNPYELLKKKQSRILDNLIVTENEWNMKLESRFCNVTQSMFVF